MTLSIEIPASSQYSDTKASEIARWLFQLGRIEGVQSATIEYRDAQTPHLAGKLFVVLDVAESADPSEAAAVAYEIGAWCGRHNVEARA